MHFSTDLDVFKFTGDKQLSIKEMPTSVERLYQSKKDYKNLLREYQKEINELQNKMYAHNRYGALLLFQAMDAAGKDSTIQHVMSGINPHGVKVFAFKKPSSEEIDHTFLWRTNRRMPARGTVHIFNRSYYEEVLVVKVHDDIARSHQNLPEESLADMDLFWEKRYRAIQDMENYESDNGVKILKFFLNVSKEEQKRRFLSRIDTPEKNWKFSSADIKERGYWEQYMQAYEHAINATASDTCPWFVIPADDKKNMRLIVSAIVLQALNSLELSYPKLDQAATSKLSEYRALLTAEES